MDINVANFRQNYRIQLELVLKGYRNKMGDIQDLWWAVNERLPQHPRNSYYYFLNLEIAKRRLNELTGVAN